MDRQLLGGISSFSPKQWGTRLRKSGHSRRLLQRWGTHHEPVLSGKSTTVFLQRRHRVSSWARPLVGRLKVPGGSSDRWIAQRSGGGRIRLRGPTPSFSFHRDRDDLGDHRRIVWNVILVAEHQLQGVGAGRQFHGSLGLAAAVVDMVFVGRDVVVDFVGPILTLTKRRAIDEQMMVAGVFPCRRRPVPRPCPTDRIAL